MANGEAIRACFEGSQVKSDLSSGFWTTGPRMMTYDCNFFTFFFFFKLRLIIAGGLSDHPVGSEGGGKGGGW